MPIVFFALAGAFFGGGIGGSWYFWKRGQQEAAKRLSDHDAQVVTQLLEQHIDLQDLRQRARDAGLDPDEVERGYRALRDGQSDPRQRLAETEQCLRNLRPSNEQEDANDDPPPLPRQRPYGQVHRRS